MSATPDLTKSALSIHRPEKVIGFCLEDQNLEQAAQEKLIDKGLDIIIANKSAVIGQNTRDVSIYRKTDKSPIILKNASLEEISHTILSCI